MWSVAGCRPGVGSGARSSAPLADARRLGEAAQVPAVGRADGVAHALPTVAVAVEVAVLELDEGSLRRLRGEPDLHLAALLGVGLDLPAEIDVPADEDPGGRLVGQHASPVARAAIGGAFVDVTADVGLEHHLGKLSL